MLGGSFPSEDPLVDSILGGKEKRRHWIELTKFLAQIISHPSIKVAPVRALKREFQQSPALITRVRFLAARGVRDLLQTLQQP
jgi:hypothetical protein